MTTSIATRSPPFERRPCANGNPSPLLPFLAPSTLHHNSRHTNVKLRFVEYAKIL